MTTGKWNSCAHFKTVEDAIENYDNICNCGIHLVMELW